MKKIIYSLPLLILMSACGGTENGNGGAGTEPASNAASGTESTATAQDPASKKGIGKFTDVKIAPTLDAAMSDAGIKIYDVKCASCHKLTDERLVGPGWKGVTERRTPEWIMNFSTNVDEMLTKDPEAQAQLEICLVRMPNQNLSDDDARHIYEFMRKNDGVK